MNDEINILTTVLIERLTHEQLHAILEGITACIVDGYCPLCEGEQMPIDEQGHVIEDDDVSMADHWREQHYEDCPVVQIERSEKYTSISIREVHE